MEGNPYEELHNSIQEAINYFNRWGNRNDEEWIADNHSTLVKNFNGHVSNLLIIKTYVS